ncbi:MAG: hypothetical protein JNL34_16035 [Anaerolineae bacterium]|nr:hypothetical protein [Anaerolineae bacterium]
MQVATHLAVNDLPEFDPAAFWQEPDFLLTELVSLFANALDAELGITLMVGGAIVSGSLIGERAYLKAVNGLVKRLSREMLDKPTREDLEAITGVFEPDRLVEDLLPAVTSANGETTEIETDLLNQPPPLRYLHLKDPILIQPGTAINFAGSELPIMRVRLTQVEGWIVGHANVMSNDALDDAFPSGGRIH